MHCKERTRIIGVDSRLWECIIICPVSFWLSTSKRISRYLIGSIATGFGTSATTKRSCLLETRKQQLLETEPLHYTESCRPSPSQDWHRTIEGAPRKFS